MFTEQMPLSAEPPPQESPHPRSRIITTALGVTICVTHAHAHLITSDLSLWFSLSYCHLTWSECTALPQETAV